MSTPTSSITGKVAQFGRGRDGRRVAKLLAQFVENLERDVLRRAGGGPRGGRRGGRRGGARPSRGRRAARRPTSSSAPPTDRRCPGRRASTGGRRPTPRYRPHDRLARGRAGGPARGGRARRVLKRLLPLRRASLVVAGSSGGPAGGAGPRPERRRDPRVEPVFDPTGPVLGIDPGLSRCGYGAVTGRGAGAAAPVAYGVIRTAPARPAARAARPARRPSSRRSSPSCGRRRSRSSGCCSR